MKTTKGSIDVIIPCYRYGRYLRECVGSVLNQGIERLRIMIIDDASPDGSATVAEQLAREHGNITFLRHVANAGHISTYNEGIGWAAADYLLLLSADDYLLPGALKRAIEMLNRYPHLGFVFGNFSTLRDGVLSPQESTIAGPNDARIFSGLEFVRLSGARNIVRTPTAIVRTALQKQVGGYRHDLPHSGDMEMWLRMASHSSVGYIGAHQAAYRQHGENMSTIYDKDMTLPDLEQRRLCLDVFLAANRGSALGNEALVRVLYRGLAIDAVGAASEALDHRESLLCDQLSEFALRTSHTVRWSWAWLKLRVKRRIGHSGWERLRPATRMARTLVARLPLLRKPVGSQAHVDSSHMNSRLNVASVLVRVVTPLQRLNVRLPAAVRNPLRQLMERLASETGSGARVDDWLTPLIPHSESGRMTPAANDDSLLAPAGPAVAQRPHMRSQVPPDLNCVLVTSSLDVGGMDEVVTFLAGRLPGQRVRTTVLHASSHGTADGAPSGRLGRLLLDSGVDVMELDQSAGTRWLANLRPDVISAHDPPAWVLDAASALGIPYVETLHGMHSLFNVDWAQEALRSRKLAAVVAVSELVRQQYLRGNPSFPPKQVFTIPNGVDDQRRIAPPRALSRRQLGLGNEFLFVSLARHCLQKNTYGLVAAFADVAKIHPQAQLLIAGRSDDHAYMKHVFSLRDSLQTRDRVHIRDHHPNPATLLSAADGFVLNSFFEGWSLASMEALHAGVPVVLSEVGGAREQIGAQGERGYLVANPLGDPLRANWLTIRDVRFSRQVNREALVESMCRLVVDQQRWMDGRARLREESLERFRPDKCLRAHAALLQSVAGRTQQPRALSQSPA